MKKNIGIRSALFTLLILASIASYVYLNMVDTVNEHANSTPLHLNLEEVETPKHEVLLPDVELVKTVVQKGLDLLPNS